MSSPVVIVSRESINTKTYLAELSSLLSIGKWYAFINGVRIGTIAGYENEEDAITATVEHYDMLPVLIVCAGHHEFIDSDDAPCCIMPQYLLSPLTSL